MILSEKQRLRATDIARDTVRQHAAGSGQYQPVLAQARGAVAGGGFDQTSAILRVPIVPVAGGL